MVIEDTGRGRQPIAVPLDRTCAEVAGKCSLLVGNTACSATGCGPHGADVPELPDVVLWSVPAFVLLTVVEMVSYRLHAEP
jgi:hypothetical protein